MHVALQLIHKLFVNGLSGRVAGEKPFLSEGSNGLGMPHYTRTGLNISADGSYGVVRF